MEFLKLWANLQPKFGRNHKYIIYGSVKFHGIGPWAGWQSSDEFKDKSYYHFNKVIQFNALTILFDKNLAFCWMAKLSWSLS